MQQSTSSSQVESVQPMPPHALTHAGVGVGGGVMVDVGIVVLVGVPVMVRVAVMVLV